MPTTVLISDLHLGATSGHDVLRRPAMRERLLEAVERVDAERIVLLGDIVELRDGPLGESLLEAREFFRAIGAAFAGRNVVLVPGNHDHRLLGSWLERAGESESRSPSTSSWSTRPPSRRSPVARGARLEIRYPGIWVRDDVFATHGHYLDSHVTLPTIERLSVATVDRLGGRPSRAASVRQRLREVHAPVYDLIFSLAQGGRTSGARATAARRRCGSGRRSAAPPARRGRSAASCSDRR